MTQHPVFFDPIGIRRRWSLRVGLVALGVLALLFAVFFFALFSDPVLPHLKAASFEKNHSLRAYLDPGKPFQDSQAELKWYKQWHAKHGKKSQRPRRQSWEYSAFFVNWDDTSLSSLRRNAAAIDVLYPEWLHLTRQGFVLDNPERQEQALKVIKKRHSDMKIMPILNNIEPGQKWNPGLVHDLVGRPQRWPHFFDEVIGYLRDQHFAGLNLDFENMNDRDWDGYHRFVLAFSKALRENGLQLCLSLPYDPNAIDYARLAPAVDQIILMAYDQHWATGDPGPIASSDWVAKQVSGLIDRIGVEKLSVAIGSYGYDWTAGQRAPAVSFQDAVQLAQAASANLRLDPKSWNERFSYQTETGERHTVWFLDAVSAFNEMKTLEMVGLHRFSLWRLGSEDPSLWKFFGMDAPVDRFDGQQLQHIPPGYDVNYEGQGEILHVLDKPREGIREIQCDPYSGVVLRSVFHQFPSGYVIGRQGFKHRKMIVLTFDDGPDPRYTPRILDALKAEHVKGTFFVVGEAGNRYPKLLQRLWDEGHMIGNHTYTHPNITDISGAHLRLELNTTQRLLESRLGMSTVLFRPPYAEDVEPSNPDEVDMMERTSRLGYLTVGIHIDPKDWESPGVEEIVQRTLDQAEAGQGHVVLLHDGGGDREETVAALPQLIQRLKAEGYTFGTVADILGVKPQELMVPVSPQDHWRIQVTGVMLWLLHWFGLVVSVLFFVTILIGIFRAATLAILSLVHVFSPRPEPYTYTPKVSVIIPAYNESTVIVRTIQSVKASVYPDFEILVVNDGSQDETWAVLQANFGEDPQVRILDKPNTGKADSVNVGLAQCSGEVIVALDADTVLDSQALAHLAKHFQNPRVAAVSGNAKVGNRINLLTKCQSLEYISSQNLDRRAYEELNCITVVPGAIGAWRHDVLTELGGFSDETLAEDADLTIGILKRGWKVVYAPRAMAYTEAPETLQAFLKQRFRWMFGNLQVLYKFRSVLFNPRYGWLGLFALPNMVLFQVIFPVLTPILEITVVFHTLSTLMDALAHNGQCDAGGLLKLVGYYVLFMLIDLMMCVLAFSFESEEDKRQMKWFGVQRLLYRPIMIYLALKSLVAAHRGQLVGWNKLTRTGADLNRN